MILQRLTFFLRFPPYERTTFWVPGALTFSALLLTPVSHWWKYYVGLCLGAVAGYYGDSQISHWLALLAAPFHFVAVATGVKLMRRIMPDLPFSSVNDMLVFVPFACLVIPLATSIPIDIIRWAAGAEDQFSIAVRSVLCVSLGLLIASPAFSTAFMNGREWILTSSWMRKLEAVTIGVCLLVVGQLVFSSSVGAGTLPALIYAPIPILLWAALRFEVSGVSWALLAIAYQSTWNAINQRGPFVGETADDNVLQMQLFLLALSLPLLFAAAGVRERRRAFVLLLSEVDERRRMENRFRLVVESTPNAMLIVDPDGQIMLANKQSERMFGYSETELLEQKLEQLLPERLRPRLIRQCRLVFQQPDRSVEDNIPEWFAACKNGREFPVEIGFTPLEALGGSLLLVVFVDITALKKAEEAEKEMVHASRLAMLSEFTASIAHEINQPLGAILSNADAAEMLLNSDPPPLDEVRQILSDIRNDDLRASDVIRKLRALLRRGEFAPELINLNSVVTDAAVILRAEARRRGIEIKIHLADNLPPVLGDRVHLQQVLLNLMVNGMEAMSESDGLRRLRITTDQRDGEVQIAVADSGSGVAAADLPHLFDRFFSTKQEGMGMGLPISRTLIEEHGGRIWADNQPGSGAIFRFCLPIQSPRISNIPVISSLQEQQE
jgi:two-component system sensor kinase FixL